MSRVETFNFSTDYNEAIFSLLAGGLLVADKLLKVNGLRILGLSLLNFLRHSRNYAWNSWHPNGVPRLENGFWGVIHSKFNFLCEACRCEK